MRHITIAVVLALVAALSVATAAQQGVDVALRAAMETETVKGDLRAAIDQYRKIAADAHDRAIAATALVRMAECYRKLGDQQARTIYERVVREYDDQKDAAAMARARLAALEHDASPHAIELRKIWTDTGFDVPMIGGISPDGRYLTYAGQFNTAVILRDLSTGVERTIASNGATVSSAISRNGSEVAYDWCVDAQGHAGEDAPCELWISPLHGTGAGRRLLANPEVFRMQVHDWSPDGTRIAVSVRRRDRTSQLAWVAVADGSLHVLKSVDWRGPTRMFFSPDGRDLAFDLAESDRTDDRDVFVIAVDGSRESPAAVSPGNEVVVGWTPDGRGLLFASDRRGTMGLWQQSFVDRKPQGAPTLIKADFGNVIPLGITPSGALYVTAALWDEDIEIAQFDIAAAKVTTPIRPIRRFIGTNVQPAWSPDGKWLAYQIARGTALATGSFGASAALAIRAADTGETRELRPALGYFRDLTWAPDGQSLVVYGSDLKGRDGIFRIDERSGDVTPILLQTSRDNEPGYEGLFWSADGRRLFYRTRTGVVHERDITRGTERVIVGNRFQPVGAANPDNVSSISISPDGRWIASTRNESSGVRALEIMPIDGGESHALLRVEAPLGIFKDIVWTPDSQSLLVLKSFRLDSRANELWFVPTDGTAPRKLDFDAARVLLGGAGRMRLHPDGRQLTYVVGHYPMPEVWALENFLPGHAASK